MRARTEIIGNGSKRAEKHFARMLLDFSREIELLQFDVDFCNGFSPSLQSEFSKYLKGKQSTK